MKKSIYLFIADGFEEVEALAPVDFLRRLNFDLKIIGVKSKNVVSSHNVKFVSDDVLAAIEDIPDCLILPGGMPGASNLRDDERVINFVKKMFSENKLVCAICAAPIVLEKAGILKGKKHTSHPSVKNSFSTSYYCDNRVVKDGNIITAKGPGTSFEFALAIAEALGVTNEAQNLFKEMFILSDK